MKIEYASVKIPGPKNDYQDAILPPFESNGAFWTAIADGVGGRLGGARAAIACIEVVKTAALRRLNMHQIFAEARERIQKIAIESPETPDLASTLTVVKIEDRIASVGHVGDSRVSHLRGRGIMLRTKDQTEAQRLVDNNIISKYQARSYRGRNILYSSLSSRSGYNLYENRFDIELGDRILLSTDGFHDRIHLQDISRTSLESRTVSEMAENLNKISRLNGVRDDCSVLVLQIQ